VTAPPKSLPVVVALLALAAGCVGSTSIGDAPDATTVDSPADTATPTPDRASNQPDPDKTVRLENDWNDSVEIRIRVVREATGQPVHEGTYVLDAGEERTVYDVADAGSEGVESFRVTATARNATEAVTIETSACSTDAYIEITASGELYPFRGVC
jgi:hypothetical protein